MLNKITLIITLLLISISAIPQVVPKNEKLIGIREEIVSLVKDSIIPSMAIAVVKDGEIVWQEAIGYANVRQNKVASINSMYPLGSVSKSITATGIMHMVNANKLDLNQDISSLISPIELKNMNGNSPEIKLWQLISMNAGINHGYGVFENEIFLPLTKEEQRKFFEETTIVAFEPGTTYEYSNRAFYLSEVIIENYSRMTFQQFMDQNIFCPLGMENTVVYPYQHKDNYDFVTTYSAKNLKELTPGIGYPSGGSGIWSSINDMTKFVLFHMGVLKDSTIINNKNLEEMHNFRQGPADLYGIGWFNTGGILFSNGNVGGGNASVSIDKENKFAVICLLNKTSWDGLADQYAGKIKAVFSHKPDTGFQEWIRIYGTPYASKYELLGKWNGIIKQPVTYNSIPVQLLFNDSDEVILSINDQNIKINNPTFNLFKELEGSFNTSIPNINKENTRCSFKLKLDGNILSGYLQYDQNSEIGFYRLPLFMELKKI